MKDKRFYIVFVTIIIYSLLIWPTPYEYFNGGVRRVNKITGELQEWGENGYRRKTRVEIH